MPVPSITWLTLKQQIARMLDDTSYQRYPEQLLLEAANDALVAFASAHTGLASDFNLTGDGTAHTFDLPSNIVDSEHAGVFAVQWTDQEWLYEERYFPKMKFPSTARDTGSSPKAYILWPVGQISFSRVPESATTIVLHYVAYFPRIVGDASAVLVPMWAREAVKLHTAASVLWPGASKAANLRQFQSRREAGKPEDNPLLRLAEHYMARYYQILCEHPLPQYRLDPGPGGFY